MKFIKLTAAKIEGETKPTITTLGKVAFNIESISIYHEVYDKFDEVVPGVVSIRDQHGQVFLVKETMKSLEEKLAEFSYE